MVFFIPVELYYIPFLFISSILYSFICFQAYNSAGCSEYSTVSSIESPPGSPGLISTPRYTATPTSLHLTWSPPPDHGDPITHYSVDIGERSVSSQETSCDIHELTPHTTYRFVRKISP